MTTWTPAHHSAQTYPFIRAGPMQMKRTHTRSRLWSCSDVLASAASSQNHKRQILQDAFVSGKACQGVQQHNVQPCVFPLPLFPLHAPLFVSSELISRCHSAAPLYKIHTDPSRCNSASASASDLCFSWCVCSLTLRNSLLPTLFKYTSWYSSHCCTFVCSVPERERKNVDFSQTETSPGVFFACGTKKSQHSDEE